MKHLKITIGGVTVAIESRERDLRLGVRGPHERFVTADAEPDISVEVVWEHEHVEPGFSRTITGPKIFDSGGVWQLYREGDLLSFHLRSPKFGPVPYARATFNPTFTTGVVHLRRGCFDTSTSIYPLEYPVDELLITNWLALGRGVEVHACGVVDSDGTGYLFAGFSGAGKTTTARLWCENSGVAVLSDDRIVLRKIGPDVWMYGTPWHGDEPLASPARALLHRGFFLHHGAANEQTSLIGSHAVTELFARSFPPFFSAHALESTVASLSEIAERVPFFNLRFVPDATAVAFLRAAPDVIATP